MSLKAPKREKLPAISLKGLAAGLGKKRNEISLVLWGSIVNTIRKKCYIEVFPNKEKLQGDPQEMCMKLVGEDTKIRPSLGRSSPSPQPPEEAQACRNSETSPKPRASWLS